MNVEAAVTDPAWLQPHPAETAVALPAFCYFDDPFHALERNAVFARSWQLVGREDQVAANGDHLIAEIAGVPLVVVRGHDGVLRALHNVCRHRAGPLATCDGKGASALTCKYHGWSYALDGTLRGAPEMGRAQDFDVASIRLPQAQVAVWHGLVFAALDAAVPFAAMVDGIDRRLPARAPLSFTQRVSYAIACDWKVYVDNFLEGYHLPVVHPQLNALLDYRTYSTELAPWFVLQSSPLGRANPLYGDGAALYYWLYPNTMLNFLPGRLQTNRVLPFGAGRCRVDFDFFHGAGHGDPAGDAQFSDLVQHEDSAICEAVQRGLASGSYEPGRLNPARERGVWHFHQLLRAGYRAAMPSERARR
jgi:choline monooxygenase